MIYVLLVAVAFLGLVCVWLLVDASHERDKWARERSELLTRIQHPEVVPRPSAAPVAPHVVPEDAEELGKVGQVFE